MVIIRFWIFALCVAWIGLVGRQEIIGGDLFYSSVSSSPISASSCSGSFSKRYECRSSRLISGENAIFLNWGKGIGVVFVPPLAVLYLFGKYARRREDRQAERARQAVLKRKRAQRESEKEDELKLDSKLEPTS